LLGICIQLSQETYLLRVGSRIFNQNNFVSEVSIDAAVKSGNNTFVVISNAHKMTHRIEIWWFNAFHSCT